MRQLGVDRADVQTDQVSITPQYGPDATAITGYQATNSLRITDARAFEDAKKRAEQYA